MTQKEKRASPIFEPRHTRGYFMNSGATSRKGMTSWAPEEHEGADR